MKKIFTLTSLYGFLFCDISLADSYYFKGCTISNAVTGNYIINLDKNIIEVKLEAVNGSVQNFSDKIKLIEKKIKLLVKK